MPLFNYDKLPSLDAYLERIGYTGSREVNRETLNALVLAHQQTVPFENLDCNSYGEKIRLDMPHLFEKVVTNRRGGYCFELNGLFVSMLRDFGFDAYSGLGRIVVAPGEPIRPILHRTVLVRLDGKLYLCDVGFGGPMAPFAVEVNAEPQTFFGETFWVEEDELGWYLLKRLRKNGIEDEANAAGDEAPVMYFSLPAATNEDFAPMNVAMSEDPASIFVFLRWASLRTPNGYVSMRGNAFNIMENGVKTTREVSEDEAAALLQQYMNIRPVKYEV